MTKKATAKSKDKPLKLNKRTIKDLNLKKDSAVKGGGVGKTGGVIQTGNNCSAGCL